jgi:hypothetical protein
MKILFSKLIHYETCGKVAAFAAFAALFLIGFNYNKLVIPEAIYALTAGLLTTIGVIAFLAYIYWTCYYWTQFTKVEKIAKLIKSLLLAFLFVICSLLTFKVLYLHFR